MFTRDFLWKPNGCFWCFLLLLLLLKIFRMTQRSLGWVKESKYLKWICDDFPFMYVRLLKLKRRFLECFEEDVLYFHDPPSLLTQTAIQESRWVPIWKLDDPANDYCSKIVHRVICWEDGLFLENVGDNQWYTLQRPKKSPNIACMGYSCWHYCWGC